MNWKTWVTTCLLAAVAGVTAGVVVVGVTAALGRTPVAEAGLPAPGERATTGTTTGASTIAGTTIAGTVRTTSAPPRAAGVPQRPAGKAKPAKAKPAKAKPAKAPKPARSAKPGSGAGKAPKAKG